MTATYTEILAEAKDAYLALLEKRVASTTINGRTYTFLDLEKIENLIDKLEARVAKEAGTRRTILLGDISRRAT